MIYVASPYRDPDPAVVHQRYLAVVKYAADYMLETGEPAFSLVAYGHPLVLEHKLPDTIAFWDSFMMSMMLASRKVIVLRLFGHANSEGLKHEVAMADSLGIPVEYGWLPE